MQPSECDHQEPQQPGLARHLPQPGFDARIDRAGDEAGNDIGENDYGDLGDRPDPEPTLERKPVGRHPASDAVNELRQLFRGEKGFHQYTLADLPHVNR